MSLFFSLFFFYKLPTGKIYSTVSIFCMYRKANLYILSPRARIAPGNAIASAWHNLAKLPSSFDYLCITGLPTGAIVFRKPPLAFPFSNARRISRNSDGFWTDLSELAVTIPRSSLLLLLLLFYKAEHDSFRACSFVSLSLF